MEFFALSDEQDLLLKELRVRINRLQSGGTIDSIKAVGGSEKGMIGASFLSLKTLALNYSKNTKIATILWNTEKREEQIVAAFLFETDINKEKIIQLLAKAHNQETIEYLGSILIAHSPVLDELLDSWLEEDDEKRLLLLISASSKYLQLNKKNPQLALGKYKQLINRHYTNTYLEIVASRYRGMY